ncbi:uncharacterized protein PRCAT00000766001 [Priceomyces carsonii]|uniref:uncharacterized protein n=1 Tax=Priceomyces carsonii TaxID=28549 RepID=UPI002ED8165F|nr:unnamed protein product [Priceomyces carsonii]
MPEKKLCKFYQQGNCRYGKNCSFSHEESALQRFLAPRAIESRSTEIKNDMQDYRQGHYFTQPLLSSYGLESPAVNNLISGRDMSPEELRIQYLEAVSTNSIDQYNKMIEARVNDMKYCANFLSDKANLAVRYQQKAAEMPNSTPKPFINRTVEQNIEEYKNNPSGFNSGQSNPFGSSQSTGFGGNVKGGAFGSIANPFASNNTTGANNNKSPFQSIGAGGFGSSGFGGGLQPSGSENSAFGSGSGSTAFGSSGFGSARPASGTGTSAFGSAAFSSGTGTSAFGSSGFGTTAKGGSPFGSSSLANNGNSTQKTSPFGNAGFGSTLNSAGNSAFGSTGFGSSMAQNQQKPGSVFGSSNLGGSSNATTQGFGSSGFGSSGFGSAGFGSGNQSSLPFASAGLSKTSTINGSQGFGASGFGQSNKANPPSANSQAASPFGTQSAFSNNTNALPTNNSSGFGASGFNGGAQASPFGSVQASSSPFASQGNTAGATFNNGPQSSPFGHLNNVHQNSSGSQDAQAALKDVEPYLIEAFSGSTFKLGDIPEIAPPIALC